MKGLIIVHGTSQDVTSTRETTVQIAKAARAAGHRVVEIGGPGSTERSILRGFKRNSGLVESSFIDEIGIPGDYAWDVVAGTATGAGIDDILAEIESAAMDMLGAGVTSIDLVGFSRGAVSLALALEQIGRKLGPTFRSTIPIGVCLLDPVPGPWLVQRHASIPSFVSRVLLLTSKHEGRPGFGHLALSVSPGVKFTGDLVMGVHGDIGGSTQSDMTLLVKDQVAKFLALPAYQLSPEERSTLTFKIMANPEIYTNPGCSQWMSRRGIGWSGHEGPNAIELPSASASEDLRLWSYPPPSLNRPWEPRKPWNPTPPVQQQVLIIPQRPVRDRSLRIVFPPPRVVRDAGMLEKVVQGLARVLKKVPK